MTHTSLSPSLCPWLVRCENKNLCALGRRKIFVIHGFACVVSYAHLSFVSEMLWEETITKIWIK